MLVLSIIDYAPAGDTKLLNIALLFGTSPATEPANWAPTEEWHRLEEGGGDPQAIAATLDKLVLALAGEEDHFAALENLAGYHDELDVELPVPLLYHDRSEGLALIQGALAARAAVPIE